MTGRSGGQAIWQIFSIIAAATFSEAIKVERRNIFTFNAIHTGCCQCKIFSYSMFFVPTWRFLSQATSQISEQDPNGPERIRTDPNIPNVVFDWLREIMEICHVTQGQSKNTTRSTSLFVSLEERQGVPNVEIQGDHVTNLRKFRKATFAVFGKMCSLNIKFSTQLTKCRITDDLRGNSCQTRPN